MSNAELMTAGKPSLLGQRTCASLVIRCRCSCSGKSFRFAVEHGNATNLVRPVGFQDRNAGRKVLLIDPWLTNPVFERGQDEIAALNHVDLVLVTHGHSDHVGNAVEIGKKTRAKLVATFDLSAAIVTTLGYPSELADVETTGHMGGTLTLLGGEIAVTFVPAWHGSGVSKEETAPSVYAGNPAGMVIAIRGGPTIYHTGDTDLFSDMALVSRFHKVDIMLV